MSMNPILVALDVDTAEEATGLAVAVRPHVGGFKVGLELLSTAGPRVVGAIAELGLPVFCDAKLHDIPNTVAGAARGLAEAGARWITVHASGGVRMMEAAVAAAREADGSTGILAVTVLTSLHDEDLEEGGIRGPASVHVERLAALAHRAGVEGVVCSGAELEQVTRAAPGLLRVTPGIRPPGVPAGDQQRVVTPAEAMARGADKLVIGRAITAAADPVAAAAAIAEVVAPEGVGR